MPKTLLVTRPQYDSATHYLFYWASLYIKYAKSKYVEVIDLKGKRANRKPQLVCFNGHGDYNLIAGDEEILVKANDNESLLTGTIVNVLACSSAKLLAHSCINNGTVAFIGYTEEFIFFYNNQQTSNPLNDSRARLFLNPANEIVYSLLKGHSVEKSYQRSQKYYLQNIQRVLASDSTNAYLARYLIWDMKHQVFLGNRNTTL
jgi:hypothetical protein